MTGNELADAPLTEEERQRFLLRLRALLARRAACFTMCESTSLPAETARELLESLCFTLRADSPARIRRLLDRDLEEEYVRGTALLREKIRRCRRLWETACLMEPELGSVSLRETLRSIGGFFRRYDVRYFAHQLPAGIDYPLCAPVPETLAGVDYLTEYLRRLLAETALLRAFDPLRERQALAAGCPWYRAAPVNLCRPVGEAAAALRLIGADPAPLALTADSRRTLAERLAPLDDPEAEALLRRAAGDLCRERNAEAAAPLLERIAAELLPRLRAAMAAGDLSEVFPEVSREQTKSGDLRDMDTNSCYDRGRTTER